MLKFNLFEEHENDVVFFIWTIHDISIILDEEYFVDGGVAFSEDEAKSEVSNAINKYLDENPELKNKYSRHYLIDSDGNFKSA